MFALEMLVAYPAQGVGKIEGIDRREVGGVACDFYIVRILANNITLMVPVQSAAAAGLRQLVSVKAARQIMDDLYGSLEEAVCTGQNWNRRFREYTRLLKSPDLREVAKVLRELLLIGRSKDLSFGERRLLEQAMNLVSGELSEVLDTSESDLREDLLARYAPPMAEADAG
ncbi:MAG: CarD family transcriptional regulator [Desulfovibrio sp.]|nr:CarD family transcriptional regulator [Desulfovibrio sp.]